MKIKRKDTKTRIIEKASFLIHKKGYRSTGVMEIVSAVGIKKGGFYHYFISKDDLGLKVLDSSEFEFTEFLDKVLSNNNPEKALNNFLDSIFMEHRNNEFIGGCIFGNMALEMADENQIFADVITGIFLNWIKKIEKVVLAAQEKSQLRKDISAGTLARHIVLSIEGGIMLSRLTKNEAALKETIELLKIFLKPIN